MRPIVVRIENLLLVMDQVSVSEISFLWFGTKIPNFEHLQHWMTELELRTFVQKFKPNFELQRSNFILDKKNTGGKERILRVKNMKNTS